MEESIDLVDSAFWGRDPQSELAWLRANAPVWCDDRNGVWGIATYELVKEVSTRPDLFSSTGGIRPDHGPTPQMIDGWLTSTPTTTSASPGCGPRASRH